MRWLRELLNPALKCARIGHRTGLEYRKGYRKPSYDNHEYRYFVCMAVREERPACLRCNQPLGEWAETQRDGLNGYSWPADQAEKFDQDREYWTAQGIRRA